MIKKLMYLLLLWPVLALATDFVEGKDYVVVNNSPTSFFSAKSKTPTVLEFFSYGCPWCYRIEPNFNAWSNKLGKNVDLEKVPVVFKPEWELYAKAYYTAKTLAMTKKVTPALFKAIQQDKKPLATNQAMIQFFVGQGVNKEIAKSAFETSPTIEMRVKEGLNLMSHYQITGVPAFVINDKYKTDLQMAGSPERLFAIMDYLVKKS